MFVQYPPPAQYLARIIPYHNPISSPGKPGVRVSLYHFMVKELRFGRAQGCSDTVSGRPAVSLVTPEAGWLLLPRFYWEENPRANGYGLSWTLGLHAGV